MQGTRERRQRQICSWSGQSYFFFFFRSWQCCRERVMSPMPSYGDCHVSASLISAAAGATKRVRDGAVCCGFCKKKETPSIFPASKDFFFSLLVFGINPLRKHVCLRVCMSSTHLNVHSYHEVMLRSPFRLGVPLHPLPSYETFDWP